MKRSQQGEEARRALAAMQSNLHRLERKIRALIIDDSMEDCVLIRSALKDSQPGIHVDFAHSQQQADELCANADYDVIFLDLLFPKDSGVKILRDCKCMEKGAPVILVTGLDDDAVQVKEAMDAGAKVIFTKPISQDQLSLVFGRIP